MPKQTKVCRVCGKTYESCKTARTASGVFNWREMCCSPECGSTYFKRVQAARNKDVQTYVAEQEPEPEYESVWTQAASDPSMDEATVETPAFETMDE